MGGQDDGAATGKGLIGDPAGGVARLLDIMRRLRDPVTGCPWDIEQDFSTIAPYTLEEAHEVADAIERKAWDELRGELGDLLFQVVLHGDRLGVALGRDVHLGFEAIEFIEEGVHLVLDVRRRRTDRG